MKNTNLYKVLLKDSEAEAEERYTGLEIFRIGQNTGMKQTYYRVRHLMFFSTSAYFVNGNT